MSDESFFREVSEELRQDRVKAVWGRFGTTIIAAVVAIVVATAAYVAWQQYAASQAAASGDRYMAALESIQDDDRAAAMETLQGLSEDGYGVYPTLATMTLGGLHAQADEPGEAVAAFDAVAQDSGATQAIRDMAAVRAAYILVDSGSLAEVRERVERLTGDSEPLRYAAREAIGTAAWKAGDLETAGPLFKQLASDDGAPRGINSRAQMMVELINGGIAGPQVGVPDEAPAPAPEAEADAPAGQSGLEGLMESGASAAGPAEGSGPGEPADGPALGGIALPTTELGTGEAQGEGEAPVEAAEGDGTQGAGTGGGEAAPDDATAPVAPAEETPSADGTEQGAPAGTQQGAPTEMPAGDAASGSNAASGESGDAPAADGGSNAGDAGATPEPTSPPAGADAPNDETSPAGQP